MSILKTSLSFFPFIGCMTIQDRRLARLAKVASSNNPDGGDEDNGGEMILF